MTSAIKLNIIRDVEDRVKDESKTALVVKSQFQRELASVSQAMRDVRYSELLLDEAVEVRKEVESKLRAGIQPLQAEVKRIYEYRIQSERKNALYQTGGSMLPVHSDIIGNLLTLVPGLKSSLEPYLNRALPSYLRREVWKALLRNDVAEADYSWALMHDRMRTVSKNEVEITQKSQELLTEFCPAQAHNYEILMWVKSVLSYLETKLDRKLPEPLYYLMLPLVYVMGDSVRHVPALIGYSLSLYDINKSTFIPEGDLPLCDLFLSIQREHDPSIVDILSTLIDLRTDDRTLTEFIAVFLARLSSGFFGMDCAALIYDQLIIKNSLHFLLDVLALTMSWMRDWLRKAIDWDHFVETFRRRCRRMRVRNLESLLASIRRREDVSKKVALPNDLYGEDYLQYVNQKPQDKLSGLSPEDHLLDRKLSRGTVSSNLMGLQTEKKRRVGPESLLTMNVPKATQQLLDKYMDTKGSSLMGDSKGMQQAFASTSHRRKASDDPFGITPWSKGLPASSERYQVMGGAVPFLDLSALDSDLLEDLDLSR